VRKLSADTTAYVRRKLPKIYSRELVDVIVGRVREAITGSATA
jgi:hypothetical protein